MSRRNEFSWATMRNALARQDKKCASCGTRIAALGEAGRAQHRYGEGAQAHHVVHIKGSGSADLSNCVILCSSCHYSVHEGGNYRFGIVMGMPSDFPHFNG